MANPEIKKVSTNFSKGLNLSVSHMISPEEVQQADNFLFTNGGAFVREGTLLNASLPAPIVAMKKHYKQDGTAYIAAFAGGNVYISYTSGVFGQVSCEPTSGNISITAYDDFLYFTNYSNVVKTYDGSSIDNTGLSTPVFTKFLGDFESTSGWSISGAATGATLIVDPDHTFLHVVKGVNSLMFMGGLSGAFYTNSSNPLDLTQFGTGVSSDTNDLIQLFTLPTKKTSVSVLTLIFTNTSQTTYPRASVRLDQLSSWVYASNDSWAMIHTLNKSTFGITSGFDWSNCVTQFYLNGQSSIVTIDGLKMVRTPPLVTGYAISGGGIYFDSLAFENAIPPTKGQVFRSALHTTDANPPWVAVSTSGIFGIVDDGNMFYKTTFIKRGPRGGAIESNPSFQSSGVFLSGLTVTSGATASGTIVSTFFGVHFMGSLTDIPIAPNGLGVIGRNIYRRSQVEANMRFVQTINDNVTTTFLDNVPKEVLGSILDETRDVPPTAKYIYTASTQQTYYLNITEDDGPHGSRVRFSQPYAPHYVPLGNVFDVDPNDGAEITGVFEFLNLIHVLKGNSTWILDSGTPTKAHSTFGCIAPNSVAVGPNEVFWLADEGIIVYSLRFRNVSQENAKIDPFLKTLSRVQMQSAAGVYYRGLYLLAINDGTGTGNNTVLVYDHANGVWSKFPIQVNCWDVWQGAKDGYRLFYGNNSGLVCEFLTGSTDLGTSIPWSIRTKEFGNMTPTMTLRNPYLYARDLDGTTHTITATPYLDFVANTGESKTLTSGPTKFGIAAGDDAGFVSVGFSGTGRIQIYRADLYGKEEGLR